MQMNQFNELNSGLVAVQLLRKEWRACESRLFPGAHQPTPRLRGLHQEAESATLTGLTLAGSPRKTYRNDGSVICKREML